MNGNCYTYPLILSKVSIKSSKSILLNCLDFALIYDYDFVAECKQATIHAISVHRKAALEAVEEELALPKPPFALDCRELQISKHFDNLRDDNGNDLTALQSVLDATPFCELIVQSIPVNKIHVKTEQLLWHQRLGHLCDGYLYSVHKFIDGVPKFK